MKNLQTVKILILLRSLASGRRATVHFRLFDRGMQHFPICWQPQRYTLRGATILSSTTAVGGELRGEIICIPRVTWRSSPLPSNFEGPNSPLYGLRRPAYAVSINKSNRMEIYLKKGLLEHGILYVMCTESVNIQCYYWEWWIVRRRSEETQQAHIFCGQAYVIYIWRDCTFLLSCNKTSKYCNQKNHFSTLSILCLFYVCLGRCHAGSRSACDGN